LPCATEVPKPVSTGLLYGFSNMLKLSILSSLEAR
jgi:hypothetical protein